MNVGDLAIIYPVDPIDLGPVMLRVAISTITVKKILGRVWAEASVGN